MDKFLIAMVVLFVTSLANSGKMEESEGEEFLDCSLDKDVFLFHNKSNINWPRKDRNIVIQLHGESLILTLLQYSSWKT